MIKESPMFLSALANRRRPRCDKGYIMTKDREGRYALCRAQEGNGNCFCICNGLLSSGGYNTDVEEPLYTVGANGYRVDRISTVRDLMDELKGTTTATQLVSPEAA